MRGRMMFPRYRPLSLPRRWVRDIMYFGRKSYWAGGNTVINIASLAAARRAYCPSISHAALLVKAVALVGQRWPQLRQAYMPFPFPHFYLHPHTVATIVVEREWRGEHVVLFDQIQRPEEKSLAEIDRLLRGMKRGPVEGISGFRHLIRMARIPWPIRGLVWRFGLYFSGRLRAKYFGTLSINSIVARRTEIMQSVTPLTFAFYYGVIEPNGDMPLQIIADHRVIDGAPTRRVATELQSILNTELVTELRRDAAAIAK